ncbi:MAG: T9SS type A sorting domain-containing protein [Bacteroidota bacterium]
MKNAKFTLLLIVICFLLNFSPKIYGQTLPSARSVNWTIAGLRDTTTIGFQEIDMQTHGVVGNGVTSNDTILSNVISSLVGTGAIIKFPNGNFLFNHTITLPANVIIKGKGAANTIFTMNLNGAGNSFNIHGTVSNVDTTSLIQSSSKDSNSIVVQNTSHFSIGDWVQIMQLDTDWVTSAWAENTVGQILNITSISGNKITLASPLRINFVISRFAHIRKINPIKNVGIECLKIERIDSTAPEQSSNINFLYAVNCWVSGIESHNCTFAHIDAEVSSNLLISRNYFHHAFWYGSNGRAYGVLLNATTNECRVEDNVFEHLRHSMILQSGANGNVFAYNYSFDPIWETSSIFLPANSAGDMVLHGNYPYANLFEGNICQNIVIDDSHGQNGPDNTFFRNRAEGYGIFFSASTSPNQIFIGNDIPNTTSPYSIVNYTIQGTGHFLYGNNNKGTIVPSGTVALPDISYAYTHRPDFIPAQQWGVIGTPNVMGSGNNPAHDRYSLNNIFGTSCGNSTVEVLNNNNNELQIYPNPIKSSLFIKSDQLFKNVAVFNGLGQTIISKDITDKNCSFDTSKWNEGLYVVIVRLSDDTVIVKKIVKVQ